MKNKKHTKHTNQTNNNSNVGMAVGEIFIAIGMIIKAYFSRKK